MSICSSFVNLVAFTAFSRGGYLRLTYVQWFPAFGPDTAINRCPCRRQNNYCPSGIELDKLSISKRIAPTSP